MQIRDHFSLPYAGMKDGEHTYLFTAGPAFFEEFENSPVKEGSFTIELQADKRPGIMELDFYVQGHMACQCDRCLADISLPVQGEFQLVVKVGNGNSDDVDVLYIRDDQPKIDLSQFIYEYICLSIPLVRVYDCETGLPRPCNMDILSRLSGDDNAVEETPYDMGLSEKIAALDVNKNKNS